KREGERYEAQDQDPGRQIRPNHNVTVHGMTASSFATSRIAAQAAETAEVVTLAASTSAW
ncbi:MAG: hypothetical protein WAN60_13990, partial [Candidatus Sulfotelmatobacter sp.]